MPKDLTFIAQTNFRGTDQKFGIRRTDRRQHMYVIGKTGTGKTQFLKSMALQDVENGEGLAIIDPHGEFVEEVLESIPEHRMKDVVYFNPADMDHPVSFNIMDVRDPKYKHLIASGLIGIFTKIWANVWSARMEYILANSILALLDTPGTTLLGIPRMLVDRDYRQKIINNLQDPVVKSFWINEYEEWESRYRNEAIAPVQNKVGQFLNVSFVRNIVGQAKNTVDIDEIMNTGKILLVNVSKGRIGEDNSAILGAMIITKIQLSAMERVRIPENDRRDFYLYVDEFQNFATDSFRNILSEARKYRLNLVMAHQYIGQLVTDKNTAVRDAVFGNVGTMLSFRVGAEDAEFLEKEFTPEFLQDDLIRLANRDIYLKLMINGLTSRPFSAKTITIPPIIKDDKKRNEIIKFSREKYARSKQAVEDEINRWAANLDISASGSPAPQKQNTSKQSQGHVQQDGTTLYDTTCSNCGKKTKVVFEPTSGKPVYCKSCLKKIKPPKGSDLGPIPAMQASVKEETQESDSALASLGIEFGPVKDTKKPGSSAPTKQTQPQPQQKSFESAQGKPQQPQAQKQPQVAESVKIENVDFKNSHHQKDVYHQNQPPKREINLAELRKALEESLKSKESVPVLPEKGSGEVKKEKMADKITEAPKEPETKVEEKKPEPSSFVPKEDPATEDKQEVAGEEKPALVVQESKIEEPVKEDAKPIVPQERESIVLEERKPEPSSFAKASEDKQEIKLLENPPELKPELKSDPEPEPVKPNPDEELQKRIAQEKMADEIQKNLGIDFSMEPSKKKEIKPGETVKF